MSVQGLCPFLNKVISSLATELSSLYELDINPLSDVWFANVFFSCVGSASFAVQKLFSLM
jgi:hypothetical protein